MESTITFNNTESRGREGGPRTGSVRLISIHKRYSDKRNGEFVALASMDLDVRPGEFLSILGPSGSGKTTTLRIIGGFVRPDDGRVEISGRDVTDDPPNRRDVNTVFQSYALFPHMSVEANVGYGLKVRRVPREERRRRVEEALRLVRLEEASARRPSQLSGGMQQRVALARAIANRPSVLLLDEPLGALDRKLREDMQVELRQLQTSIGVTFVYVTHDQEEALAMSDRVVVMRSGRIQQIGSPTAVYDDPANLWVAGFVGASNSLRGTVKEVGRELILQTDVAQLVAGRFDGALARGQDAVAVVRPENISVDLSVAPDGPNRVRVRIEEVLPVGGHVRCIARTAGGVQLVAHCPREVAATITPKVEGWFTWTSGAVRVYPVDELDGPGGVTGGPGGVTGGPGGVTGGPGGVTGGPGGAAGSAGGVAGRPGGQTGGPGGVAGGRGGWVDGPRGEVDGPAALRDSLRGGDEEDVPTR